MPKEFIYRGKTLEQLKAMSIKEFAELLPARTKRSLQRGLIDQHKRLLKKCKEVGGNPKISIKTHCRDMIILPEMVGTAFAIHNGKEFIPVMIEPEMLGHYLGELMLTRKRVAHSSPGVGATKSSSALSVK